MGGLRIRISDVMLVMFCNINKLSFVHSNPNAENGMILKTEIKVPIKHMTIVIQLLPCSRTAADVIATHLLLLSYAGYNHMIFGYLDKKV